MQAKKIPMRKCTGCGQQRSKRELIRVVLNKEGELSLDATGKQPGRGAYLCPSAACFRKAKKNRGLERGLSTAISPEIYEKLEEEIARHEAETD